METLAVNADARTTEDSSAVDHASPARNILKRQVAAYKLFTESLEKQLSHHSAKSDEYRAAIATLESERQANAILTAERDELLSKEQQSRLLAEGSAMVRDAQIAELSVQVEKMRKALSTCQTWQEIKEFGPSIWHRNYDEKLVSEALALPDLSAKKHETGA